MNIKELTETSFNNAEAAKTQTESYEKELREFVSAEQKVLSDAESTNAKTCEYATGEPCKKSLAEAKISLDSAKSILLKFKENLDQDADKIHTEKDLIIKQKAIINEVREKNPTSEEEYKKLVEKAVEAAKIAGDAATKSLTLLTTAKQRAAQEKPAFIEAFNKAIEQTHYHLRDANAIQKEACDPVQKENELKIKEAAAVAQAKASGNVLQMKQQQAEKQPSLQALAGGKTNNDETAAELTQKTQKLGLQ